MCQRSAVLRPFNTHFRSEYAIKNQYSHRNTGQINPKHHYWPSNKYQDDFSSGTIAVSAYKIDVFQSGKFHSLDKRYSEFEELHKQLKKVISTPEFPPKKVLKWQSKVLESRQIILEAYLQGILEGETIPRSFFKFLEITLPRSGSFDSLDRGISEPISTHQSMVGFSKDAYLQENYRSILPDIVVVGVHEGLYIDQNDDDIFR